MLSSKEFLPDCRLASEKQWACMIQTVETLCMAQQKESQAYLFISIAAVGNGQQLLFCHANMPPAHAL
jgi:hypothetical protein